MNSIKKHGAYGVAVSVVLVAALALVFGTSQVAQAAAPTTVNVIIDDDDDSVDAKSDPITVRIVVAVGDGDPGAEASRSNETVVTISTTAGTFENGLAVISIQCAAGVASITAEVDDNDAVATTLAPAVPTVVSISEGLFGNLPDDGTDGCSGVDAFLTLPGGTSAGNVIITASTLNGKSDVEVLVVKDSTSKKEAKQISLTADATVISGAKGSVDNGSEITLTTQDSDGKTSRDYTGNFLVTTDLGWFVETDEKCGSKLSALAVVKFASPESTITLCVGTSDSGTATVTASDLTGVLTDGSDTVEVNGNVASWTLMLDSDLNTGTSLVGTVTARGLDSNGAPAPDETKVSFIAGPAAICAVIGDESIPIAIGPDGSRSATIAVVGAPGTCVIRAFNPEATVVGLLAEFVDDVGPPSPVVDVVTPAPAPAPADFMGELPTSGYANVTFTGSIADLKAALATACPGGAPIFGSVVVDGVGSLIPYFPTTALSAPNAAFEAAFAGGLSGTPLIAGNCGS